MGPFPVPFLLSPSQYLGCSKEVSPRARTALAGEAKEAAPSPTRQQRGRLTLASSSLPPNSSAVPGPQERPVKWHFLCLCSFHTRLYRSAILPILPPHLKVPTETQESPVPSYWPRPVGVSTREKNIREETPASIFHCQWGTAGTGHRVLSLLAVPWQNPQNSLLSSHLSICITILGLWGEGPQFLSWTDT